MLLVMLVLLVVSIAWSARQRTSFDLVRGLVMTIAIRVSVCLAFIFLGLLFLVLLFLLTGPEMHDFQVWLVTESEQMAHTPH